MTVYDEVKRDRMIAMKAKDTVAKNALTTLLGELENNIKKDPKFDQVALVRKFIKDIDFTIENTFGSTGMLEMERSYYEVYLPKQLSEVQLKVVVKGYIAEGVDNMGKIMGRLKQEYANRYDGKMASGLIKTLLS